MSFASERSGDRRRRPSRTARHAECDDTVWANGTVMTEGVQDRLRPIEEWQR